MRPAFFGVGGSLSIAANSSRPEGGGNGLAAFGPVCLRRGEIVFATFSQTFFSSAFIARGVLGGRFTRAS